MKQKISYLQKLNRLMQIPKNISNQEALINVLKSIFVLFLGVITNVGFLPKSVKNIDLRVYIK